MIDITSLASLSTVALGGIVAAVVAGWRQVKAFGQQIMGLVIVQGSYDYRLRNAIYRYVRSSGKMAPSGANSFIGRMFTLRGDAHAIPIPFHVPNHTAIFYGRKIGLIMMTNPGGATLVVRGIRGLTNIHTLTANAVEEHRTFLHDSADAHTKQASRYSVTKIMGLEKYGSAKKERGTSGNSQSLSDESPESSDSMYLPGFDKSFAYDPEDYTPDRESNSLDGLYFEQHVLEYFEQAKQWSRMGKWYSERNIPWRRGWLLYGPGGTGKSSIAKALAKTLGMPVYQYFLGTLSDQEFSNFWQRMDTPCVVLFEDFDSVFEGRESLTEHKSLTFDTILNHISGVDSQSGVFLVVTTNRLDKIDPAMGVSFEGGNLSTRPGRIDTVIEVGLMSEANRRSLAASILRDWPDLVDDVVANTHGMTPSQVQEICVQHAYVQMNKTVIT